MEAEPQWVVVRVGNVTVQPTNPATSPPKPWDIPVPAKDTGAGCGLLGLMAGATLGPVLGKGVQYVCQFDGPEPAPAEWERPDLVVLLHAAPGVVYQTPTAPNTISKLFETKFVVPMDAATIPREGIALEVIDRDEGGKFDPIGTAWLSADQLRDAARSPTGVLTIRGPDTGTATALTLHGPSGATEIRGTATGLVALELVVIPYAPTNPSQQATTMSVDEARLHAIDLGPGRQVYAGEILEIGAAGQYRVSPHYPELGPEGYTDGLLNNFNRSDPPFRPPAPHGVAIARLGEPETDAQQPFVVGNCTRTIAKAGGRLAVGVNDRDYANNSGQVRFLTRVRPPTPDEWLRQAPNPCACPCPRW